MNYSKPGSTACKWMPQWMSEWDVSMDPNGSKTPCYVLGRERERDRGRILKMEGNVIWFCHFIWETNMVCNIIDNIYPPNRRNFYWRDSCCFLSQLWWVTCPRNAVKLLDVKAFCHTWQHLADAKQNNQGNNLWGLMWVKTMSQPPMTGMVTYHPIKQKGTLSGSHLSTFLGTKTTYQKPTGATKSKQPRIELRINTPKTVHLPNFDLSYDQRCRKKQKIV